MKIFKIYIKNNIGKALIILSFTLAISYINYKLYGYLNIFFKGITKESYSFDMSIVVIIILFYSLLFGANIISKFININLLQKGVSNLLNYFMKKVFYSEDVYTLNENSRLLLSKATMSCNTISKYYTSIINIISTIIILGVYAAIIMKINTTIMILCLVVIPLIIVCTVGIKNKITQYQSTFFQHSKNRTSKVLDAFDNIKNIKAKNEYDFFKKSILNEQIYIEKNTTIYSIFYSYFDNIIKFIIGLSSIIIIYFNAYFLKWNNIENDHILMLFIFIPLFFYSFANLYSIFLEYFKCKPYLGTYEEMCNLKRESNGNLPIKEFKILETKNVFIQLDNMKNIKIPNMKIAKGEKILIVGESGVGKTTLFNILLGFIKNYQGIVRINGIDLKELDIKSLRNLIGVSFQNNELFSLSLEDNITLGSNVDIASIINLCQLNKVIDKNDVVLNQKELSGGEKSRINLAQTLIRDPDVLFIDESLSTLDEEMEITILKNIIKTYKGITIIYISHRKTSIELFDKEISVV